MHVTKTRRGSPVGSRPSPMQLHGCTALWSNPHYRLDAKDFVVIMHTAVSEAQWIVGLLQWKIIFKSPSFYMKSKRLLVFFCLVQNCPAVIWVACIDIRESSKWFLMSASGFSEAFWTFIQNWDPQSQQTTHMQLKKKSRIRETPNLSTNADNSTNICFPKKK